MKLMKFSLTIILLLTLSCSSDDDADTTISEPSTFEEEVTEGSGDMETDSVATATSTNSLIISLEEEVAVSLQSTEVLNSVEDVENNGWNTLYKDPETGEEYRNRIGYLYLNLNRIDTEFVLSEPEGILVAINPAGNSRIMGVAFIIEGEANDPPEGFTGDEDVWEWVNEEQVWVLHVWIRGSNPRGIFSFYHPGIGNRP